MMMWRRKVRQLEACDVVVEGIFDKVLRRRETFIN